MCDAAFKSEAPDITTLSKLDNNDLRVLCNRGCLTVAKVCAKDKLVEAIIKGWSQVTEAAGEQQQEFHEVDAYTTLNKVQLLAEATRRNIKLDLMKKPISIKTTNSAIIAAIKAKISSEKESEAVSSSTAKEPATDLYLKTM